MSNVAKAINVEDLRRMARRRLPRFLGDYVEGGAGSGAGVRRNIDAFRRYHFIPRAFADVGRIDTSVNLFGRAYSSLFGISPVGTGGLYRRGFDAILADTAREANIPFILSGAATASVEEISRRAPDHTWFQLYASKEERLTDHFIARARDAGVKVLVFTVDYPIAPAARLPRGRACRWPPGPPGAPSLPSFGTR
jgi:(S)-mandelate dehydrogenase